MKKILILLGVALTLAAQTRIASPAWVTGTGAAVAINATEIARWVTVYALPTNSATNCVTTDMSKCPVVGDGIRLAREKAEKCRGHHPANR